MTELEAINKYWAEHKSRTNETQSSASVKLGMKQAAFNQYLTGSIKLNVLFILKLSRLMGVSPVLIRPSLDVIFGEAKGKRLSDKLDKTIDAFVGN